MTSPRKTRSDNTQTILMNHNNDKMFNNDNSNNSSSNNNNDINDSDSGSNCRVLNAWCVHTRKAPL